MEITGRLRLSAYGFVSLVCIAVTVKDASNTDEDKVQGTNCNIIPSQ